MYITNYYDSRDPMHCYKSATSCCQHLSSFTTLFAQDLILHGPGPFCTENSVLSASTEPPSDAKAHGSIRVLLLIATLAAFDTCWHVLIDPLLASVELPFESNLFLSLARADSGEQTWISGYWRHLQSEGFRTGLFGNVLLEKTDWLTASQQNLP